MRIEEIFEYLDHLGINCGELRKPHRQGLMNDSMLKSNLKRLLQAHVMHRGYKDAFNDAE